MIELIILVVMIILFYITAKEKGLNRTKWVIIAILSYLIPIAIFSFLIFPLLTFGWINVSNKSTFQTINVFCNLAIGFTGVFIAKFFLNLYNDPNYKNKKKKLILLIIFLVSILCLIAFFSFYSKNKKTSIYDDYGNDSGVKKIESGDYRGAINDFTKFLKKHPNNSVTYYNRGFAYSKLNLYDSSIIDFKNALRYNNFIKDTVAIKWIYKFIAISYQTQNNADSSLRYYNIAINMFPHNLEIEYSIIELLFQKGDTKNGCLKLKEYENDFRLRRLENNLERFYKNCK